MTLAVADIYCGAGGLSAGFRYAKRFWVEDDSETVFRIVYGVDNDKEAIRTFRNFHFPNMAQRDMERVAPAIDIEEVDSESLLRAIQPHREIDVLIGGPNCQGVSAAGLRNPTDDRNRMLLSFIQLVADLKPKWFVMENVPGLVHANNRELLREIFRTFHDIRDGKGNSLYDVSGDVLLAADYGVPQFRYRLFIIGTLTGSPIRFPPPTHRPLSLDGKQHLPGMGKFYQTVENAIGDLSTKTPIEPQNGSLHPQDSEPANHFCMSMNDINLQRISTITPGGDWRNMPIRLLPERYFATRASDQKGAYGRLRWDWPAYTITNATSNITAGPFAHPNHNRSLSVREAARLQSFKDEHMFFGSILAQYRQIGNAVPPKLAQAVAEAILYSNDKPKEAHNWGVPGRITLEFIEETWAKKSPFPVLTPRFPRPNNRQRKRRLVPLLSGNREKIELQDVWNTEPRIGEDPFPKQTRKLRRISEQPGNFRATKRARTIIAFIDGVPKSKIVTEANTAEASVQKWVNGYFSQGLDGWRAYHTPIIRIAGNNKTLADQFTRAIKKVRRVNLSPSTLNGTRPQRLYMNKYLLRLKEAFGEYSVFELIDLVEETLGHGIGTVYVSDLLAIYDIIMHNASKKSAQE